jgi:NhaP-type Na+/H+ or K+/H+ antiporter
MKSEDRILSPNFLEERPPMSGQQSSHRTTRRRFAFWVGFGIFALGEKLHAKGFDTLAAATMRATEAKKATPSPTEAPSTKSPEHWTAG